MNGLEGLSIARQQLSDAISNFQTSTCDPLTVTPWVAASCLIKSVRRGHEHLAMRAAATLLRDAPDKLWRRIGGLAFEEMGLANTGVTELATAALGGKRFRESVGGEWCVASTVVGLAARAAKDRAADDLLMTVELHPAFTDARRELAAMTMRELLGLMIEAEPLPVRALACWFAISTDQRLSSRLSYRRGDPQAVFDALHEAGYLSFPKISSVQIRAMK